MCRLRCANASRIEVSSTFHSFPLLFKTFPSHNFLLLFAFFPFFLQLSHTFHNIRLLFTAFLWGPIVCSVVSFASCEVVRCQAQSNHAQSVIGRTLIYSINRAHKSYNCDAIDILIQLGSQRWNDVRVCLL